MARLRNLVPNRPTKVGREAGEQLARLTENGAVTLLAAGAVLPTPCKSCAFRRGTIPNGCEETVADALKCVLEGDREFMCHEVPHGNDPVDRCAGYRIARAALLQLGIGPLEVPWDYSIDILDNTFVCTNEETSP